MFLYLFLAWYPDGLQLENQQKKSEVVIQLLWRVRCVTELLNIELRKFLERLVMLTH